MKRFVFFACLLISIFVAVKFNKQSFSLGNSFTYVFLHENYLHLAVNVYCLYYLRSFLHFEYLAPAYITAVLLHVVLPCDLPVIGFSVVLFFFTGILAAHRYKVLFYALPFIAISFFCPHIAALFHVLSCLTGMGFERCRMLYIKYGTFRKGYQG